MIADYAILILVALFLMGINALINCGKQPKKLGTYKNYFGKDRKR